MKNTKQLGRTIGFLLIMVMAAGIPSTLFRGLSTSLARKPDFLESITVEATRIPFVVLLSIIASFSWLIIVAVVFPLFKKYNPRMALLFASLWALCFAVSLYGDLSHLSLLSLAKEAQGTSGTVLQNFNALGFLKIKDYIWSHFITLVLYASATILFFYFLFKTKLIPSALSIWGLIAISIVFTASWLNIFGISPTEYPFMHNGLHMIALTTWLSIKGFNENQLTAADH